MKKKKHFTMVELLVGMAVLAIMMVFLMKAFVSAESVASTGNKSMDTFEKSNIALDFMSGELNHLIVSNSPRTEITMTYNSTFISFVARLPFGDQPALRHKIEYEYVANTLTRKLYQWDDVTKAFPAAPTSEDVMLEDIEVFEISCYGENNTLRTIDTDYNTVPHYCQIKLKIQNPINAGSENVQRHFTRRVYYKPFK